MGKSHNHTLYYLVLLSTGFIMVASIGPVLTGGSGLIDWYNSWQRIFFSGACHQYLDRTFLIADTPMAVCSRCAGVYTSLFAGVVLGPVFLRLKIINSYKLKLLLIFSVSVIIIHPVLEITGLIVSTHADRFITGFLLGTSVGVLITKSVINNH